MASLGVVGLGLIGGTLARRLLCNGQPTLVYDLRQEAVEQAVVAGAKAADSCRELAAACDNILVCVQNDQQCIDAIAGDNGLLQGASKGSCIAVISTVLPSTITSLATDANRRGVHLVDTPLAGRGMFSVENGTMSAFVGDEGPLVSRLEPVLRHFSSTIVSAGKLGSGAALKLAHNVVVYAGFAAMIEAVELARGAGVRDGLLEEVAHTSGALSELSAFTLPYYKHLRDDSHAAGEDDILRVAAALLEKDLRDAVSLGESCGVAMPLAKLLSHFGARVFPTSQ